MIIATTNALNRITVIAFRCAATVSRSIPAITECIVTLRKSFNGGSCIIPASGTIWSPLHFQSCFSREILRRKPRTWNSSNWHPSSVEYWRANGQQMHLWRYGHINYHSPVYHEGCTDSRQWTGQVCCHYVSSLWTGYAKIKSHSPIRSCSTVSIPVCGWSFLPSDTSNCLTDAS